MSKWQQPSHIPQGFEFHFHYRKFILGNCLINYSKIHSSLLYTFKILVSQSVQSLSRVRFFATPWITAHQASLSITNSQSSPKLFSIESVMPSSHLILGRPLLFCPQSLPASESFPVSQLCAWGGQSTGVSALASVLPKNAKLPSKTLCQYTFTNNLPPRSFRYY